MKKQSGLAFRARACPRCGGDAYLERAADDREWRCLQCARVVPAPAVATVRRRGGRRAA